jgi:glucose/arabinose dehydrogenase
MRHANFGRAALLAACLISLAACGGSEDAQTGAPTAADANPAPTDDAAAAVAASTAAVPAAGSTAVASAPAPAPGPAPVLAPVTPKTVLLNSTLQSPWGMTFLPDGRMLVTQRGGSLVILAADGRSVVSTVSGVPAVSSTGQGGLLDVALDPDFATSPWVYFTFAEQGSGAEAGMVGAAVGRGRLVGTTLQNVAVIFRQVPKIANSGVHFGSRIAFRPDKTLFVTLGERGQGSPAQDVTTTLGKVVRINRDGTIPSGNPTPAGGRAGLWSWGHRNPQGAAVHPETGALWINEHGPQGGDELNLVTAGGNYGWPNVSYGCQYGDPVGNGCAIGGGAHAPAFLEPISTWTPTSVAPAGLIFYTGTKFPQWRGHLFFGALAGTALWRVQLDAAGRREVGREKLFASLAERIRDVAQGPDGYLYLLTDTGKLIQVRD